MSVATSPGGFYRLEARRKLERITRVLLVGSGKGGVGKSFVACGLALSLSAQGFRTGIFDIDIHGASVPNYLGLKPPLRSSDHGLEPKTVRGTKVMSVSLLTGSNPVPMRGEKKDDTITEFFALTNWGTLDYLLVDLPPSTGDELLSALRLFSGRASLLLVTTPSRGAVNVVSRLRRLTLSEGIPVVGVALNMSFMRTEKGKIHPFGRLDAASVRRLLGSELLVEFPLSQTVNSKGLLESVLGDKDVSSAFELLARKVADLPKDKHRSDVAYSQL